MRLTGKNSFLGSLFRFMWERKLWWMVPMLGVLLVLGVLIFFAQSSTVTPFVYVLF